MSIFHKTHVEDHKRHYACMLEAIVCSITSHKIHKKEIGIYRGSYKNHSAKFGKTLASSLGLGDILEAIVDFGDTQLMTDIQ